MTYFGNLKTRQKQYVFIILQWVFQFQTDKLRMGYSKFQSLIPKSKLLDNLRHLRIVEDKCSRLLWQLPSDPLHSHWHQILCTRQHQLEPLLCWASCLGNTAPGQIPLPEGTRPVSCKVLLSAKGWETKIGKKYHYLYCKLWEEYHHALVTITHMMANSVCRLLQDPGLEKYLSVLIYIS